MNKNFYILFFLILTIPIFIFPYILSEEFDSEYVIDDFCADFLNDQFNDLIFKENFIMISGGCYNIEQLAIRSLLKLKVPVSERIDFELINIYYDDFEFHPKIFEYGLTFNIKKSFSIGFLANPTFYKKDSDFTLNFDFNGFNTKNRVSFTLENFDNNYSHKNWNEKFLEKPRIYENYPFIFTFSSAGKLKDLNFFTFYRKKFYTKENHYYYSLEDTVWDFSVDTSYDYLFTQLFFQNKKNGSGLSTGIRFKILNLLNTLYTYQDTLTENDKRFKISYFLSYQKKNHIFDLAYEKEIRDIIDILKKDSYLFSFGYNFSKDFYTISLWEIISNLERELTDRPDYNSFQSRILLSLKFKIKEHTYFVARKGLESDIRDIKKGGRYFWYDKMYVQFYSDFDIFFKRK